MHIAVGFQTFVSIFHLALGVSGLKGEWLDTLITFNNRALYTSKLDIGYCQKAGDIVNLKSGYSGLQMAKPKIGWNVRVRSEAPI